MNLIEIQLFDYVSQTWNTTNYVVYDLGDRDARTFGYFIDRNVADFIRFDGLLLDTLQYQLKYRFKIDKDYFGGEISIKTLETKALTVKRKKIKIEAENIREAAEKLVISLIKERVLE